MSKLIYEDIEVEANTSQTVLEINPDLPERYFKVGDVIQHKGRKNKYIITGIRSYHPKTYLENGKLDIDYDMYNVQEKCIHRFIQHLEECEKVGECQVI